MDQREESDEPAAPPALAARMRRLVLKELREILRDRRTIITLVVMPLLIYPLLAIVFQRFLFTSIAVEEDVHYVIGVDSELAGTALARQLEAGDAELERRAARREAEAPGGDDDDRDAERADEPTHMIVVVPDDQSERYVVDSALHVAALRRRSGDEAAATGLQRPLRWELVYRAGSPTSEAALAYVEERLGAYNELDLDRELARLGVALAMPALTERHPIQFSGAPTFSLAALIPLILVLMTVTGAVYPAIDLTAGERERGTLETLIAAPVPRMGLLVAKYVAVLTVALLTAVVNLVGMTITAHSTGLAAALFGDGMSLGVVVTVLLLLALFAAFFSAILLALTSCARSFKEAQAYIIPLMLVCLVPGVVCLMPGLEFTGWMAVTPLVNIVMLARDLLEGSVVPHLAVAAVCSTLLYVAAAITLAARIFGTDAILYGSPATWSDMFRQPPEPRAVVSLPAAMFALAIMFSAYFVLGSGLARSTELAMGRRLVVVGLVATIVFGGVPLLFAMVSRVNWSTGLGLRRASGAALVGAGILGLALWPLAHEVFLLSERLGWSLLGEEQVRAAETMIAQWRAVPLWLVLAAMAVAPGVFEELSFRGLVYSSLQPSLGGRGSVAASALVFGLFHEVLTPGRFLASTFLGFVLGWVRMRSGSVVPCMVLHTLHNGLLLTMSYYHDDIIARGWDLEAKVHLPALWLAGAAAGVAVGVLLVRAGTGREREHTPQDSNLQPSDS